MAEITTTGKPGYSSAGTAWLSIEQRTPRNEALSFDVEILATYELFYKDGEVILAKSGSIPDEPSEIVYSEILNTEENNG